MIEILLPKSNSILNNEHEKQWCLPYVVSGVRMSWA